MESDVKQIIGIPVYDSVDMIDVTAPYEIFTWAGFEVELVAAEKRMHCFREGFRFEVIKSFAEASPSYAALWVPGGDPTALNKLMKDPTYLGFLRDKAAVTPLVASVCEGAMLLAAAGLLDGYEATTHWAFIPCLKGYREVKVVEGHPRYHLDRDRLTGGGIFVESRRGAAAGRIAQRHRGGRGSAAYDSILPVTAGRRCHPGYQGLPARHRRRHGPALHPLLTDLRPAAARRI